MTRYYLPISHDAPVAIEIKGHRLILLTTDEQDIREDLPLLGGDTVHELNLRDDMADQTAALSELAEQVNGGVVLTPPGVTVAAMIHNLENELPWIH